MNLCECGTYNDKKAKFCSNCGKAIKKDIYSIQLAWKLIAVSVAIGGLGYALDFFILILLAFPLFFLGIIRIGLAIDMGG